MMINLQKNCTSCIWGNTNSKYCSKYCNRTWQL